MGNFSTRYLKFAKRREWEQTRVTMISKQNYQVQKVVEVIVYKRGGLDLYQGLRMQTKSHID